MGRLGHHLYWPAKSQMETKMLLLCLGVVWYFSSGFGRCLPFGCRLSFLVLVLYSRCYCFSLILYACFAKKYMKIDLLRSAKQPALVRCVLWNCLSLMIFCVQSFCSHFCRFESPFWMPRCYPKFPISGTPSGRLHLPTGNACYPVYGAHEHEDLGGYHWLCLRVWLRHCDSYIYTLPLSPAARSATFQPNDHSICHLWWWSESFLAWSQRLYHGENLATGQGCFCLSDCCIWVAFRILGLNVDFTSSLWDGPRK